MKTKQDKTPVILDSDFPHAVTYTLPLVPGNTPAPPVDLDVEARPGSVYVPSLLSAEVLGKLNPARKEPGLVRKLAEILADVPRIAKRGLNKFQNYEYVMEADLADAIRPLLAAKHIFVFASVVESSVQPFRTSAKGDQYHLSKVMLQHTFVDGDTGESFTVGSVGTGEDSGDKGIYKAITGAQKYFLSKNFMVSTGDDPEQDASPTKITPAQAKKARELAEEGLSPFEAQLARLGADTDAFRDAIKVHIGRYLCTLSCSFELLSPEEKETYLRHITGLSKTAFSEELNKSYRAMVYYHLQATAGSLGKAKLEEITKRVGTVSNLSDLDDSAWLAIWKIIRATKTKEDVLSLAK